MDTIRYVDHHWHHYCERDSSVLLSLYTNFESFKRSKASNKFSYIQDFGLEDVKLLESKIRQHLEVSNHVFVGFGEPLIIYKDEEKHGWDHEHNVPEGPHYYTDDFINKFKATDNITFFANAVSHVDLNRPLYYLNDMFFESRNIYERYDVCANLLKKLENRWDKKHSWELMCSNAKSLYETLQQHNVNQKTFSTCHALGITHWGPDVVAPKGGKLWAETFTKEHNIRCSDLIDPSIYNESYYSCVVETVIPPDNRMSMFSEKQAKPIVAQRPFIIVGTKNHLKAFRGLGFKTFAPVIDESYDDEPDYEKRCSMILDAMDKLSQQDPREVYKKLYPVLEHNYKHFYNNNWNVELQKAWLTPTQLTG